MHLNTESAMASDHGSMQRGRPLGFVSQQVLEKIGIDRQATSKDH